MVHVRIKSKDTTAHVQVDIEEHVVINVKMYNFMASHNNLLL